MCSGSIKEENYKKAACYVAEAARKKAKLTVLPEHWDWLGKTAEKRNAAEKIEGPSIRLIQDLAVRHQCEIIAGSILEANGNQSPYNTSVMVHEDGSLGKSYRKIHLFDTLAVGGHKESESTTPGDKAVVENFKWGSVGLSICYDLRFSELYRKLVSMGATILTIPANFTAPTGMAHWESLIRARAIENQCFVIAAGQTGITGTGWEAHGHSMIVSPWGEVLAIAGKEEGISTAELNLDQVKEIRAQMPVQSHRKVF